MRNLLAFVVHTTLNVVFLVCSTLMLCLLLCLLLCVCCCVCCWYYPDVVFVVVFVVGSTLKVIGVDLSARLGETYSGEFSLPIPPPLPSLPLPPLRSRPPEPEIQLGGLGERCKLPQQGLGLGQSPSRNRI